MKKIAFISIVAAMFIGCGDNNTQTTQNTSNNVVAKQPVKEAVKQKEEVATKVSNVVEETAKKVETTTKEVEETVNKTVNEQVEKVEKAVSNIKEETKTQEAKVDGKTIYSKNCSSCHGVDGKLSAFNKSKQIAGLKTDEVELILKKYKDGSRDIYGMGNIMKAKANLLSPEETKAVAEYISSLKK